MRRNFFVLIAGKRRSGKDMVGALLAQRVRELLVIDSDDGDAVQVVCASLADQVKQRYAAEQSIDVRRLYSDNDFKEQHRPGIIALAMRERERDPAVWCRALQRAELERLSSQGNDKRSVVLVCDHRFCVEREHFGADAMRIRVQASDETRARRGWRYTPGVDDHASETELDADTAWFACVQNDHATPEALEPAIDALAMRIVEYYLYRSYVVPANSTLGKLIRGGGDNFDPSNANYIAIDIAAGQALATEHYRLLQQHARSIGLDPPTE